MALEGLARPQQLLDGLPIRGFDCYSTGLDGGTQIGGAKGPVRGPLFPQIDSDVGVVEDARATAALWNDFAERQGSFADEHSTL